MATITDRVLVYDGWYKLWRLAVTHDDGERVERHLLGVRDAVAVLPYDAERRTALVVSMPRAPVMAAGEPPVWEALAGTLDTPEPADTARREAIEEAGVRIGALEAVAHAWALVTLSSERLHLYLAPYAASDRIGSGGGHPDEGEHISVHEPTLAELKRRLDAGEITDIKLLVLVQALLIRSPHLFS